MTKKRRTRISIQKLFCFISFIFLLVCVLWYGSRTVYFYLDSKKKPEDTNNDNSLYQTILKNNIKNKDLKRINKDYYFYKNANNNYLEYSNITWRIIKITDDKKVLLITEEPITLLAYGTNNYQTKCMNKIKEEKNTGILENNITNIDDYLTQTKSCEDNIKDIKNITCKKENDDNYFSLLDINDYINTGAKDSFINNGYYIYLNNKKDDEIWYLNSKGELDSNDGTEIYGIKPTITIKEDINLVKGTGTKEDPFIIEEENQLFASYVKLDEDIYRVYDINKDTLKLSLNDYLKEKSEKLEYSYSKNTYFHNDTVYNSLAYYLNHTYLNNLNYKNNILTNYYNNYYYGESNNYNYKDILDKKVDTKVYTLSIGDPILNNLNNYFLATGTNENNGLIYIKENDGTITIESVETKKNIVPTISINKEKLTKGTGSISDPYRME